MARFSQENLLVRVVDSAEVGFRKSLRIENFPYAQILLCTSGSGHAAAFGGIEVSFKAGDLLYLNTAGQYIFRTDSSASMKKIACDTSLAPYLMDYFSESRLRHLEDCSGEILRIYNEIFEKGKNAAASENREISLKLYRLMILIGQEWEEKKGAERSALEKMADIYMDYMTRSYKASDTVTVSKAAEELFMQLYNTDAAGINVIMRLERSKGYTALGCDPEEIAEQCGFENAADMARRFKEHFGISMEEYRNLYV